LILLVIESRVTVTETFALLKGDLLVRVGHIKLADHSQVSLRPQSTYRISDKVSVVRESKSILAPELKQLNLPLIILSGDTWNKSPFQILSIQSIDELTRV